MTKERWQQLKNATWFRDEQIEVTEYVEELLRSVEAAEATNDDEEAAHQATQGLLRRVQDQRDAFAEALILLSEHDPSWPDDFLRARAALIGVKATLKSEHATERDKSS